VNAATFHVVNGLRTRVQVHGDGTPLLLIGGVWSQVELWDDVLPHLDGFRAITFDPPGIGLSDRPRLPDLCACSFGKMRAGISAGSDH
jgi:pimeloyl-ACP methyl ester carboxylesterase